MQTTDSIRRNRLKVENVVSAAYLGLPVAFVALIGYIAAMCHHIP